MYRTNNQHVGLYLGVCTAVTLLWNGAQTCKADDRGGDCSAVYDAAIEQEQGGYLRDAIEMFRNCAVDSCSNPGRQTCQAKLFRLELDAPSVVPLVKDEAGAPLVDVTVKMDGVALATRLDGRAFTIDPGLHDFVFSTEEETIGSTRVVIVQGERNRAIWMTRSQPVAAVVPTATVVEDVATARELPAPAPTTSVSPRVTAALREQPNHSRSLLAPYLLGGTALAGAAAYVVLSSWARADNQQLSRCAPSCQPQSVSHIRTLYLAADVSLGVAAAAALSSAALFIFSGSSSSSTDKRPAPQRSYALSVQPERAGALATLRGSF
jgi:hypothetical protein